MSDARGEIENLLYVYAERIDAGDFAGVAEMFANAEVRAVGSDAVSRGRDEVFRLYESTTRRYECGTPRTKHVVTNPIIALDGDRATARSCFTVMQQTPVLPLQIIITGRYRDAFERAEGVWRFASREMVLEQLGDLSQHLLMDVSSVAQS